MNDRMPALYIGHGAPPLLDDALWTAQLRRLADRLARPTAILIVSAHWESAPISLTASGPGVGLVYDFGGFDPKYSTLTYPSLDASALAARIAAVLPDTEPVHQHPSRGLDHGAWVPLRVMYPDADIPVVQMSLPTQDPEPAAADRAAARCAPRRGRAGDRLGLPHPRPAVPPGLPHRRPRPELVGRLRRLGRRGHGPRRRRRAGGVPRSRPRDALRPPQRRALHPAVHHPRRRHRPRCAGPSRSSTASGWAWPSARCWSPDALALGRQRSTEESESRA